VSASRCPNGSDRCPHAVGHPVPVPENVNHRTVVARVPRTCQTGTEFGHSRLTRGHDFFVYKESDLVADPLGASSKLVMLVRFSPMIAVPGQGRPQSRARDATPDREGKTGARLPTYVRLVIRRPSYPRSPKHRSGSVACHVRVGCATLKHRSLARATTWSWSSLRCALNAWSRYSIAAQRLLANCCKSDRKPFVVTSKAL
jgi:hypothetical protein